jgi:hypothetical protein
LKWFQSPSIFRVVSLIYLKKLLAAILSCSVVGYLLVWGLGFKSPMHMEKENYLDC